MGTGLTRQELFMVRPVDLVEDWIYGCSKMDKGDLWN